MFQLCWGTQGYTSEDRVNPPHTCVICSGRFCSGFVLDLRRRLALRFLCDSFIVSMLLFIHVLLGPRIYVYAIDLGHSPFKSLPPRKCRDPSGLEGRGWGKQSGGFSFPEHVLCAKNGELDIEGARRPEICILEIQDEQKSSEETNKQN